MKLKDLKEILGFDYGIKVYVLETLSNGKTRKVQYDFRDVYNGLLECEEMFDMLSNYKDADIIRMEVMSNGLEITVSYKGERDV